VFLAVIDDFLFGHRLVWFQHYIDFDRFAAVFMGHPDGDRFVLVRLGGTSIAPVVVLNWFAEVEQLMAESR